MAKPRLDKTFHISKADSIKFDRSHDTVPWNLIRHGCDFYFRLIGSAPNRIKAAGKKY